jgi:peptidoglycan/LPS O-acetylase OafA/YrhL
MSVLVNGLLVQNIVGANTPNTAFWSIAVEVQLYFLLPVLLLLIRRRGALAMVAAVALVVAAVGVVGPHVARLDTFVVQSAPDLAALFALGVVSAGVVAAGSRKSWPWQWLALAAAAPVLTAMVLQGSVWTLDRLYWVDLALAPAIACLLIGIATGRPAWLLRVLDTRPIRGLGASSYSLYLTHAPIIAIVYELIVARRLHQGAAAFLVTLAVVIPLTIGFAKGFASVFEHGFPPRRRSRAVRRGVPPGEVVPG